MTNRRRAISRRPFLPTPVHNRFDAIVTTSSTGVGEQTKWLPLLAVPTSAEDLEDYNGIPRSLMVGNVKLSANVNVGSSFLSVVNNIELAIMKVPQDVATSTTAAPLNGDFIRRHPEWIFAYKYIGDPSEEDVGQQYQPHRMTSRKTMRLFSGDQLMLVVVLHKTGVYSDLHIRGVLDCKTRLD